MKYYRLLLAFTVLVFTQFGNAWGQTTYYWVGATGGNWSTAANWNTAVNNTGSFRSSAANTDILVIDGDGTTSGGSTTINIDASTITIGQFKVTNSTSVTLQSSSTNVSAITISGDTGDDFVIESGSSLNLDHATNPVSFAFTGTGNTGQISGTINLSGSNSNIINTTGGTTTVFTISSGGIVNIGTTGISLVGSTPTLVFAAGSTCNLTATLTTEAYPIPLATWNTTSNLNLASASTSTTTAVNNVQSFGNFTVNLPSLTGTLSFWDGMASQQTAAIIKGNLTITAAGAANGTGVFRALTTGSFSINGNVVINQGRFHSASSGGVLDVYGNTTINANGILDINGGLYIQRGFTFTNNGTLTGTGSSSRLNFFGTTGAQTFAGTGSILTSIGGLGIENSIGVNITHSNQIITSRVNLFRGTVTNSNKITVGTGNAGWVYIQTGAANSTSVVGGSFDVAPTFNIGSGTLGLLYSNESTSRTTGLEVPSNRTVNYVLIENVNGVIISGGNLLTSTLNFAANCGNVTTTTSNVLRVTSTATNAITRNSTTAFVNGPLEMTIPSNLNSSATYLFPIGKSAINAFELVNPTTTSGGSVVVRAEVFDANTGGTSGTQMSTIATNRYWASSIISGASNFTNTSVRLNSATTGFNAIAASATLNGNYDLLGGVDAVITSSSLQTSAPAITALNRFYVFGTLAPPTITAQPTLASATVCAGSSSGSMSITATGAASFQWQISSNSGSTWSDISGATSATYTGMTMSTAGSFMFRCNAINAAGTTTSNATGTLTVENVIDVTNTNLPNIFNYSVGASVTALTLTSNYVTTYQWYANTTNSTTGGTAISGATSASFTPSATATELGTKFYYCQAIGCNTVLSGVATVNVFRTYYSKASATDFNDINSWGLNTDGTGTAPTAIDNSGIFIIQNGSQLVLSSNATVRALTINTGKLTVNSNSLTVSIYNQNNTELNVTNGGTLEINGGTVSVNGAVYFADGSGLTQTAGLLVLYPNSGTAATSLGGASGSIITFGIGYSSGSTNSEISSSTNALKFNCTGGTIQIVDPTMSSSTGSVCFAYKGSAGVYVVFGENHTVKFGNGSSTLAGGHQFGFLTNFKAGAGYISFGNFMIDVLTGTNRLVINAGGSICVTKNLTVTSGEYKHNCNTYVSGNLTNEGTFWMTAGTLFFAKYENGVETPSTIAQTISGSGTFKNGNSDHNYGSLSFNNTSAAGITFANANVLKCNPSYQGTISGYLTLKNGVIHTGTNTLIHTQPNAVAYTAGGFGSGSTYARYYTSGTGMGTTITSGSVPGFGQGSYPFVSGNPVAGMRPRHFHRSIAAITTTGLIAVKFIEGNGLSALPSNFTESAITYDVRTNSTWIVTTTAVISGTSTYCIQNQDGFPTSTSNVVIVRNGVQFGTASAGNSTPMGQRTALTPANQVGTFTLATSSPSVDMTWTGATSNDWATASNWSPAIVPSASNATIPATGITNFPVATNVTIAAGKTLNVLSGSQLTVNGILTNNGDLTIESGATFVQGSSSTIASGTTGTYNVKQTVTGAGGATATGRFWYMGVPLNNLTRGAAFGNDGADNRLWSWSESSQAWSTPIANATTLSPTTGYVFRTGATSTTLNFSGTSLYSADASITGLTNTTGSFDGCHLMSNPYTAYLDWESVVAAAGTTNLSSTYCVRSYNTGSNTMVYDTYNATGDVAVNPSGLAMTRYIAPMQAFWIIVNPSTTGSISMTKSMLSHQSGAVGLKDITSFPAFARLNLVSGDFYDQVVVYTDVNATAEFDDYDSKKFFLPNKAQVYCPVGENKAVINALKQGKAQTSAPLTVELPSTQVYKFEMAESFVENGLVILEDKQEGIFQDMGVNPVYEFYGNSGVIADRFVLHFQLPNGTNNGGQPGNGGEAGVEDLTSGQIAVIANHDGAVNVVLSADLTTSGDIQIFDEAGRLVAQKAITSAQTSLQLSNGMGVYFVRVQTPMKTEMKKVMVY